MRRGAASNRHSRVARLDALIVPELLAHTARVAFLAVDCAAGMRVGEAVVQERAERVRVAIAHRLEAALLKFEDSVLGHTRLPLACVQRFTSNISPSLNSSTTGARELTAGRGSPDSFDDLAVAFNDQFQGVTLVKHAEAGF